MVVALRAAGVAAKVSVVGGVRRWCRRPVLPAMLLGCHFLGCSSCVGGGGHIQQNAAAVAGLPQHGARAAALEPEAQVPAGRAAGAAASVSLPLAGLTERLVTQCSYPSDCSAQLAF